MHFHFHFRKFEKPLLMLRARRSITPSCRFELAKHFYCSLHLASIDADQDILFVIYGEFGVATELPNDGQCKEYIF